MNLAEIRKKARAEREGGGVDPPRPAAGFNQGSVTSPLPFSSGVDVPPLFSPPGGSHGESTPPPPPAVELGRSPDAPRRQFDPVSIILKGREIAEQVLDPELAAERSQLLAESKVIEYLCFRVGPELYAVPISEIKEIIKPRELTEVPRAPSFVRGILSLRGVIVPIFDMRERLHFEPLTPDAKSRIVVVRNGEELCGILVDEVLQVLHLGEWAIEPPPSVLDGLDRDFVSGIGRHDGNVIVLLCLEAILDIQRI